MLFLYVCPICHEWIFLMNIIPLETTLCTYLLNSFKTNNL
jgi:hypothetical protein